VDPGTEMGAAVLVPTDNV